MEYDIVAKNNGNVDLTGVVIADPMFAGKPCTQLCALVPLGDQEVQQVFDRSVYQGLIKSCRCVSRSFYSLWAFS